MPTVTNPNGGGGTATPAYDTMYDAGNSGAATTIDWAANGKLQKLTLTAACTLTFTAPAGGTSLKLKLIQDGTGGWTCAFPASVIWAQGVDPVITPTIAAADVVALYYDGTNYYGSIIQNAS